LIHTWFGRKEGGKEGMHGMGWMGFDMNDSTDGWHGIMIERFIDE